MWVFISLLSFHEKQESKLTVSVNNFFLFHREYPCDHYTSVIAVTLVMCGCPRTDVQATALQLLQILDKRFFNSAGLLQGEREKGEQSFIYKACELHSKYKKNSVECKS